MKKIGILIATVVVLAGCYGSEDGPSPNNNGFTKMKINLTDAPGPYQQVNIDLQKVRVQYTDSTWGDLTTNAGIYDLLQLQNGVDTTIVQDSLSKGRYITHLRLVLGDSNSVMVDSMLYDLKVPSGAESGLKVKFNDSLQADSLSITLDFNADKSVHQLGNKDNYILRPVIKASK